MSRNENAPFLRLQEIGKVRSVPSAQALCAGRSLIQKEKECDSLTPPCYFLRHKDPDSSLPPTPAANCTEP